ncbi:DegQ family serine endoprotease [Sphingomonas sp.]|uniref:DegQ family serine endoprotease n=1 Tax=Sphingomonas sp. TaxID=28214 RepID=UPI002DBF14BD|nr:DegQ family serine endoprotease [Sphingomonas sp.]HEU4968028.1 DegQ family serine endoprotease [Sphingomonas sp.]
MRYAYALTTALLLGGVASSVVMQQPLGAQTPQNAPQAIAAATPPRGAPMSFADLAAKLQPAVVNISTTQRVQVSQGGTNPFAGTPFADLFGGGTGNGRPVTRQAQSLGSGFIVSADGYIVTNNHVVAPGREGAVVESITVTLPDKREFKAKLVGRDLVSDLAVLKIDAGENLPFVRFGDSTHARVGDWVLAIGNPFGLGGTVTSGIISAIHRNTGQGGAYDRYIQTDASINMGNSGGPMFDLQGNVIGINTAIFSPSGGNVGIGFAIPAEQAKPVVDALMHGGRVKRGYLGVQIQQISDDIAESLGIPKNRGELIAHVEPGQAAERAGIRQGDVIMAVNGQEVTPDTTLSYLVANAEIGARVPIELIRNGKRMTVTATLGERPPEEQLAARLNGDNDNFSSDDNDDSQQQAAAQASLGLAVQPLTPGIARQVGVPAGTKGLVIGGVDPSSDAAAKGLKRGDVIVSVNGRPALTAADVRNAVAEATRADRGSVLLLIQRGNNPARYIGLKIKED